MSTLKERVDAYLRAEKAQGIVQRSKADSSEYTLQRALSDIKAARVRREQAESNQGGEK